MQTQHEEILSGSFCDQVNSWKKGSISPIVNGTRRVSSELISPLASSSSSSTGSQVFSANSTNYSATFEIPAALHSSAAIVWIGFNSNTADFLVNEWLAQRYTAERPLQRVIEDYLRDQPIKEPCGNTNEGNWYIAMQQLGISAKMQEAVMDPDFALIRRMHPLRHWLEEFIINNYLSLGNVEDRIRSAMKAQQNVQPSIRGGAGGDRGDYSKKPPGYTTLYRATTAGRLKNVFKENDAVDLREATCRPEAASDFGWDSYGTFAYWTPQMWVADEYARYCERAIGFKWDVCVLKMVARPWDVRIEGATWELEYGDTWGKLVWYSRNRAHYPEDIRQKYEKTKVFIGPISGNATSAFQKLGDWEKVTEEHILRQYGSHGDQALQFVWKGPGAMAYMNDRCTVDLFRYAEKKWVQDPRTWVAGRQ